MTDREWLRKLHQVGCVVPGCAAPAAAHHPRTGQAKGKRAPHWVAIALCEEHHQGNSGWHRLGPQGFWQRYKLDELAMIAETVGRIARGL